MPRKSFNLTTTLQTILHEEAIPIEEKVQIVETLDAMTDALCDELDVTALHGAIDLSIIRRRVRQQHEREQITCKKGCALLQADCLLHTSGGHANTRSRACERY